MHWKDRLNRKTRHGKTRKIESQRQPPLHIVAVNRRTAATMVEQHNLEEGKGLGNGQAVWKGLASKNNVYTR